MSLLSSRTKMIANTAVTEIVCQPRAIGAAQNVMQNGTSMITKNKKKRNSHLSEPWGWHLLLDCSGMDARAINDPLTIEVFIRKLVNDIDMVPIGEPQIMWCDTHEEVKKGYTFIQIIETSNIIGHLCSFDNTGYIDVWSCKPYDPEIAIKLVKWYFNPKAIRTQFVERIAPIV